MRHLILTLLFLISAAICGRAINDVSDHLDISDGLSNNFVTDIVQDRYGYLWIGTDEIYGHRAREGTAGMKITVARRWWLMWWAVAVYVLLGSGLVFMIIKFSWLRKSPGGVAPEPAMN